MQCDSRGACSGSSSALWIPSTFVGKSVVIVDSANRDVTFPQIYCANLEIISNKAELLTINQLIIGGSERRYLASDVTGRRERRQTSALTIDYSLEVPVEAIESSAERANAPVQTDLYSALNTAPTVSGTLNGAISVVSTPSVERFGVDCNTDQWSSWSPCSVCGVGNTGVESRSRLCEVNVNGQYVNSQAQVCTATEACETTPTCNVNNGGCHSSATCATVTNGVTCTCNTGFTGDGVQCISAETDTALFEMSFNGDLRRLAPTQSDRRDLLNAIVSRMNSVTNVLASRIFGSVLEATGDSSFSVSYTVGPRSLSSTTPVCTASGTFNGSAATELSVSWSLPAPAGTVLQPSRHQSWCPAPLATFTTTSRTVTSSTVTSTTTLNATRLAELNRAAEGNGGDDDKWDDEYTLFLVGALLVVFAVLMSIGLVCAVRENSKRKMLELGLVAPKGVTGPIISPFGPGAMPFNSKTEVGPGEENKWLSDTEEAPSHFYPPGGMS